MNILNSTVTKGYNPSLCQYRAHTQPDLMKKNGGARWSNHTYQAVINESHKVKWQRAVVIKNMHAVKMIYSD